jgi:hypothetical protein
MCNSHHIIFISTLLSRGIFLIILENLQSLFSLRVRGEVSVPSKTGEIKVLHIFICRFLDGRCEVLYNVMNRIVAGIPQL